MEGETFQQFSSLQKGFIDPKEFILNLIIASLISFFLSQTYRRFGSSPSDKTSFSKNFLLLSTTTMLIITVVKSSLALSLGLVGALSIVRFRSAIKEPEELTFLFLAMTVGLGLGANQREITTIGISFILLLFIIRSFLNEKDNSQSYHLTISIPLCKSDKIIEDAISKVKEQCTLVQLKRIDSSNEDFEIAFAIEISDYHKLSSLKTNIQCISPNARFTFMDLKGLVT